MKNRFTLILGLSLAGLFLGARLPAAETVYLFLKANGTDVRGDGVPRPPDRDGAIECLSFQSSVTDLTPSGTMTLAPRQYSPIKILKRVDKSSPLLEKILIQNQPIDATFKFYRRDPKGMATEYFEVQIGKGRLSSIRIISPDVTDKDLATKPLMEEITFTFTTFTEIYGPGTPDQAEADDTFLQK